MSSGSAIVILSGNQCQSVINCKKLAEYVQNYCHKQITSIL